ncbi:nicotinate-nucleotide adenylyltransferase [Aureimonas mangrovi]|uniref:nicotinate-nucleotide adenylyltransferase n=1 Tax=Aureimonas mangrovi TaxID=2758041 RepID=UPI001FE29DC4
MRIGLFGGSFNPPHGGHLLVAETALRRLGLDRVWWMVTPGNPLKDRGQLRPLAERIAASRALSQDRRIVVTGFEARLRSAYTADTLALLRARNPDVAFVWVMGADSLAGFHHWRYWERIATTVPIAVVDRPDATLSPLYAPLAQRFRRARLPEALAASLPSRAAPSWVYLHGPRSSLSSTALRAAT